MPLHNSLIVGKIEPQHEALLDRLLWLRNHYDVGNKNLKAAVLKDVDEILDGYIRHPSARAVR